MKFLIFLIFPAIIFARPQANWSKIFGKRFQKTRIELSTTDKEKNMYLAFLDSFPCYKNSHWGNSYFRVRDYKKAFLKIYCIFPPTSIRFAYNDKRKKSELNDRAEADGMLRCLLKKDEEAPDNFYKINIKEDCYEENFPDTFYENK
ncbi:MAG: hypothetical protein ACTSXL_03915 [Alphaproteobacteria bacterium]|nr:MAG: hypothetical protein B6I23_03165 [Rickettsiaceae bacterium 4572_127]